MPYQLTFSIREPYDSRSAGITVETELWLGARSVVCRARIDTGAQVCLFRRELGELLGLEIESGQPRQLDTLAGPLTAFGHSVTLRTLGLEFDSIIYFAGTYNLPRNLLGREGWLQKLRLAVVDYDSEIYLSPYDEAD